VYQSRPQARVHLDSFHAQIVPLDVEEVEQVVQLVLVGVHRKDRFKELLRANHRCTCATRGAALSVPVTSHRSSHKLTIVQLRTSPCMYQLEGWLIPGTGGMLSLCSSALSIRKSKATLWPTTTAPLTNLTNAGITSDGGGFEARNVGSRP
jgi:hypothetical protein